MNRFEINDEPHDGDSTRYRKRFLAGRAEEIPDHFRISVDMPLEPYRLARPYELIPPD